VQTTWQPVERRPVGAPERTVADPAQHVAQVHEIALAAVRENVRELSRRHVENGQPVPHRVGVALEEHVDVLASVTHILRIVLVDGEVTTFVDVQRDVVGVPHREQHVRAGGQGRRQQQPVPAGRALARFVDRVDSDDDAAISGRLAQEPQQRRAVGADRLREAVVRQGEGQDELGAHVGQEPLRRGQSDQHAVEVVDESPPLDEPGHERGLSDSGFAVDDDVAGPEVRIVEDLADPSHEAAPADELVGPFPDERGEVHGGARQRVAVAADQRGQIGPVDLSKRGGQPVKPVAVLDPFPDRAAGIVPPPELPLLARGDVEDVGQRVPVVAEPADDGELHRPGHSRGAGAVGAAGHGRGSGWTSAAAMSPPVGAGCADSMVLHTACL
jgi:hypothetical protein